MNRLAQISAATLAAFMSGSATPAPKDPLGGTGRIAVTVVPVSPTQRVVIRMTPSDELLLKKTSMAADSYFSINTPRLHYGNDLLFVDTQHIFQQTVAEIVRGNPSVTVILDSLKTPSQSRFFCASWKATKGQAYPSDVSCAAMTGAALLEPLGKSGRRRAAREGLYVVHETDLLGRNAKNLAALSSVARILMTETDWARYQAAMTQLGRSPTKTFFALNSSRGAILKGPFRSGGTEAGDSFWGSGDPNVDTRASFNVLGHAISASRLRIATLTGNIPSGTVGGNITSVSVTCWKFKNLVPQPSGETTNLNPVPPSTKTYTYNPTLFLQCKPQVK